MREKGDDEVTRNLAVARWRTNYDEAESFLWRMFAPEEAVGE